MTTEYTTTHADLWVGSNLARHASSNLSGEQFLTVVANGTVTIREEYPGLHIVLRDGNVRTTIVLPITREQLCDLACGLWIEEMAEASDGQG
jgi:hypothetical protein